MRMYLAGKITDSNWRDAIFQDGPIVGTALDSSEVSEYCGFPVHERSILAAGELFDYMGPYRIGPGWDHDVSLDEHGVDLGKWADAIGLHDPGHGLLEHDARERVMFECFHAINSSHVVFAWIDRRDIYGTLAEIGYARGKGREVWIGWSSEDDALQRDMWFIGQMATAATAAPTPREAFDELAEWRVPHLLSCIPYDEYLQTSHWLRMRIAALEYAEERCQVCYSDEDLAVHHRTYERRGMERLSDLTVLCKTCHADFHKIVNGKPTRMPVPR